MSRPIHYAGALEWHKANGALVVILAGWAACCSGARARKIRETKAHTYDRAAVTCGRCRTNIAKEEASECGRCGHTRATHHDGSDMQLGTSCAVCGCAGWSLGVGPRDSFFGVADADHEGHATDDSENARFGS